MTMRALYQGTNIAILALPIPHARALIPPRTVIHNSDAVRQLQLEGVFLSFSK